MTQRAGVNLQGMFRILAAKQEPVEKSRIFLILVSFLATTGSAASPVVPQPSWLLSSDEREREIIHLKKQLGRNVPAFSVADELSRLLFLQNRREEAVRVLLAVGEASSSSASERAKVRKQVRVLSRAFTTNEGVTQYQAGINALISGDLKSALVWFEKVLVTESQLLDAWVKKGQTQVLLGLWDSAAESFRAAVLMNPFEPELRLWLGRVLLERGEKRLGVQEILSAWGAADPHQQGREHWRAWVAHAFWTEGRSAAAKALIAREALKSPDQWTVRSAWALSVWLKIDSSHHSRMKAFLNLFPSAYVQSVGESGLDLEGWNPSWATVDPQSGSGTH